jgi:hypothetical protein
VAVFIELQTDAFRDVLVDLSKRNFDFQNVRRPFRGIEIKEDTYGIIKVIRSDGRDIPLFDSGSRESVGGLSSRPVADADGRNFRFQSPPEGTTFNYSNFIIASLQDARQEKTQIVENFGEPYIFFFGERPRIVNVSGILFNSLDFAWKHEFWRNYEKYLRGTRLVELDARIYLYYDEQILEGYMLGAQAQENSMNPYHVDFSFTLFVTGHTYLGQIDNSTLYPVSAQTDVQPDDLRQTEQFNSVISSLRDRYQKLRPGSLESSINDVRLASIEAAGGLPAKDILVGAILSGLSDYEARTVSFLNNVKTYLYGRRMVVPKGVAGSEVTAGSVLYANQAILPPKAPQRKLPLRSRISDNVDEYIGGGGPSSDASGYTNEIVAATKNISDAEYEKKLLLEMEALGVDTSDPSPFQTLRARVTHAIVKTAGAVDFAAGIARGTVGQVVRRLDTEGETPLPVG